MPEEKKPLLSAKTVAEIAEVIRVDLPDVRFAFIAIKCSQLGPPVVQTIIDAKPN